MAKNLSCFELSLFDLPAMSPEFSKVLDIKFPCVILPHEAMKKKTVTCLQFLGFPETSSFIRLWAPTDDKVKKQIHRLVAKLLAWSMSWASAGQFPTVGFQGENFEKKSFRFAKRGQKIGAGWRPMAACLLLYLYLIVVCSEMFPLRP